MVPRFTLYGSPHSLPTYKVALMLRLAGEPFSFRYVSFQQEMHKTPAFLALSRWGQVPVLLDGQRVHLQSAAIVEHLAGTLGRFEGADPAARQLVREWLYWDVDALFPAVFGCYSVQLQELLPIRVEPAIADYHRAVGVQRAPRASRLSLCRRPHHCRPVLLRRRGVCGDLRIRFEPLAQCGRLGQARDRTGRLQGAVRVAGHEECRAVRPAIPPRVLYETFVRVTAPASRSGS